MIAYVLENDHYPTNHIRTGICNDPMFKTTYIPVATSGRSGKMRFLLKKNKAKYLDCRTFNDL